MSAFLFCTGCSSYKLADSYSDYILKRSKLKYQSHSLENFELTYWDSKGDKPLLVLIHGFGTSGKFQWYKETRSLSREYRLIIVNLLYFGSRSHKPAYTIEGQTEALHALMTTLRVDSFFLCGASYGGLVAADYASKYPQQITKLILIDAPVKYLSEADINLLCEKEGIADCIDLYVPGTFPMFKKLTRVTYLKSPKVPGFMLRSFFRNTFYKDLDELRKVYRGYQTDSRAMESSDYYFLVPVLLIWGAHDIMVPPRVGRELQQHIGSNARLEIVPDAAHLPNIENKKVVNRLILEFLKE